MDNCIDLRVILQHNVDFRGQGHVNVGKKNKTNKQIALLPPRFFVYKLPPLYQSRFT